MNKEEYDIRLKEINEKMAEDKCRLNHEYALSNNSIKKGDIISNNSKIIRVEAIRSTNWGGDPYCIYSGALLTKKLVAYKSGEKGHIYQTDKINIIKQVEIECEINFPGK